MGTLQPHGLVGGPARSASGGNLAAAGALLLRSPSTGRPLSGGSSSAAIGRVVLPGLARSSVGAGTGGLSAEGSSSGRAPQAVPEAVDAVFEQQVEADVAVLQARLQAMLQLVSIR